MNCFRKGRALDRSPGRLRLIPPLPLRRQKLVCGMDAGLAMIHTRYCMYKNLTLVLAVILGIEFLAIAAFY